MKYLVYFNYYEIRYFHLGILILTCIEGTIFDGPRNKNRDITITVRKTDEKVCFIPSNTCKIIQFNRFEAFLILKFLEIHNKCRQSTP